jgi:hypothetical protein
VVVAVAFQQLAVQGQVQLAVQAVQGLMSQHSSADHHYSRVVAVAVVVVVQEVQA